MPIFTIVKNGKLGRIIRTVNNNVDEQLGVNETSIIGAYPNTEYKLVNGVVVDLDDAELLVFNEQNQSPHKIYKQTISDLAQQLERAGTATITTLPPSINWTKKDAKNAIDQAAGRARIRAVSQGALINEEYQQAAKQVADWRGNGSLANNVPAMLQSRADSLSLSIESAATSIELAQSNYQSLFEQTFHIRLMGKASIDNEVNDFIVVAQNVINQLNAL